MLKLKAGETSFSKEQDLHLLQQAVAIRPFSQGKGLGWKMIASKLTKLDHFTTTLRPRVVRERILYLMDNFGQASSQSPNESGDSSNPEMDGLLNQLLVLREEAVKMAKHLTSDNDQDTEMVGNVKPKMDQEKHQPQFCGIETTQMARGTTGERLQPEINTTNALKKDNSTNAQKKAPVKRNYQRQPRTTAAAKVTNPNVMKFLEDREEKRLRIREEELALRREELEERKRMVNILEERFAEEKKIREQLFELLKK